MLGVSLGPAVGGLLADTYGMTAPFVAVGCASAASALYAVFRLPETHPGILKGRSRDAQGVPGSQQKPHDVDPGNPGILGRAQEYQVCRLWLWTIWGQGNQSMLSHSRSEVRGTARSEKGKC